MYVCMHVCAWMFRSPSGGGDWLAGGGAATRSGVRSGSGLWWEPGYLPQRRSQMGSQVSTETYTGTFIRTVQQGLKWAPAHLPEMSHCRVTVNVAAILAGNLTVLFNQGNKNNVHYTVYIQLGHFLYSVRFFSSAYTVVDVTTPGVCV